MDAVHIRPLADDDAIDAHRRGSGLAPARMAPPLRAALLCLLVAATGVGVQAQEPAPAAAGASAEPVLDASLGEWVTRVPAGGFTEPELEVTVFKPPGEGPFPIVVINHGRAPGDARFQPRYRPLRAAREFVQRGYAVVAPMRQGFSKSGGSDIVGNCHIRSNGELQARSVRRTLDWLATQAWADVSRNIVMGQSHGGLATLAYGMQPHPGTRLLVNFAGGLRQTACPDWEKEMVSAIGAYGAATSLPSLWFYGDNDSFFAPEVFKAAHERYQRNGGHAELVAYGRFGSDSHAMFGSREGLPLWLPRVTAALAALGLPEDKVVLVVDPADAPVPPARGHARIDQLDKLPLGSDKARLGYQAFLQYDEPKAFALHLGSGVWSAAWGGVRPLARALSACERRAQSPCRLYAVNDTVVWSSE